MPFDYFEIVTISRCRIFREPSGIAAGIKEGPDPADRIAQMRILVCLLVCTIGCRAQRPEDQVLGVFQQMEKAQQTGDANTFIGLWSREKTADAEKMRPLIQAQPNVHYTSSRIFVQGDSAVLLGQIGPEQFISMRLIKEDGRWKIKDQIFSEKAYPADSVYAMIPPPAGAFERAGSPWQNVPAGLSAADAARQRWQVRATYDESFLYIRVELPSPMAAPGTAAETPPMGWPVMKIGVSGAGEFVLHATANIGDQATFDANGRANSHRHYVSYWLMLERGDKMIFQTFAGPDPDPLVQTTGNFLDVRIPMRTMGVTDAQPRKITLGDAQWPKSALFTLDVPRYR